MKGAMLAAMAALTLQQAPPKGTPLQPTGKWGVDYGLTACTLSRSVGSGDSNVLLGFMPLAGSDAVKIVIIGSAHAKLTGSGDITVVQGLGGKPAKRHYYSGDDPKTKRPLALVKAGREDLAAMVSAERLTLKGNGEKLDLALPGIGAAVEALAACEIDLAKSWGFDLALVAKPPEPIDMAHWFTDKDYPTGAKRDDKAGETDFRATVGTDGKVTACFVTLHSSSPDLDQKACSIVIARARFHPALDKAGKPIEWLYSNSVMWLLPGSF